MTPGEEFDDGMLAFIREVKAILGLLAFVATGLLALYATYLVAGSLIFLIHAFIQ